MTRASDEILAKIHGDYTAYLQKIIDAGELTASQMKEVREFLKDNGIDSIPVSGSGAANLAGDIAKAVKADEDGKVLPFKAPKG